MSLTLERKRFNLGEDGSTLFADASDLGLYGWPESVAVRYDGAAESVFTRVGFDRDGGEIRAARYGNRIGQRLVIYND